MFLQDLRDKQLNKNNILKLVSSYDIYNYYLSEIPLNTVTNSPFRKDKNPSFGIFYHADGTLMFNDYKIGAGDCFKFVSIMESCNYFESLSIINRIFNLKLYDPNPYNINKTKKGIITNYKPVIKDKPIIRIKVKEFTKEDIEYFTPLDINRIHNIFSLSHYWVNEHMFEVNSLCYAYRYGVNVYKIYQPLKTIETFKWTSNIDINVNWYGHDILPVTGDILFIASSNKDAAVLHQLGYNAIAPHTEAQIFNKAQYNEYSKRFEKIIIFYDNDETGILKADKFCEEYNLTYIALEEEDTKDPFEFVKKYDLESLNEFIEQSI